MKNHSKETKNVSKNDYGFTQEKRKDSVFHHYLSRKERGMGISVKKQRRNEE